MSIDLTAYVAAYLSTTNRSNSWGTAVVTSALKAEQRAQRAICRVPALRAVSVSTTSGSAVVTASSASSGSLFDGYDEGAAVSGDGIPDETTVLSVDSNCQVTLTAAATEDGTGVSLTVDPDISDLAEALARRVATNLANRNLPLGVQTQVAEFGATATRVGGRDREVMRLEGPYRIVLV